MAITVCMTISISTGDYGIALHYHGTSMVSREYVMVCCPVKTSSILDYSAMACHGNPWHAMAFHGNAVARLAAMPWQCHAEWSRVLP